MTRTVLYDLWISIRRNMSSILLYLIAFVLVNYYISGLLQLDSLPILVMPANRESLEAILTAIGFMLSYVFTFMIFNMLIKKIPLRLPRVVFILPAGEKEKYSFILIQFLIKTIFAIGVLFISRYVYWGKGFMAESLGGKIIEGVIAIFTFINLNLRVGIGEKGAKNVDKNDYPILEKEEEIVNTYWFGMLLIENTLFYSLIVANRVITPLAFVIWGIVQLFNIGILIKCFRAIIRKAFSFEAIYRMRPETEE